MRRSTNDTPLLLSLLAIALVVGGLSVYANTRIAYKKVSSQEASVVLATTPPTITLGFVGDVMLDRGVKYMMDKYHDGNYATLFENASFLKEPDIMFANLEGPISDQGKNVGSIYSFRMDPATLPVLKDAGIDIVSFANNHVGDWSYDAFVDTIDRLNRVGILTCGAGLTKEQAETPAIFEHEGYRVGYLCFSDVGPGFMEATQEKGGILLASDQRLDEIVRKADKEVNTLVVSFHWGEEYEKIHNTRQEYLAKKVVDAGADLVVGHHPHVIQDIDEYNEVPIIYSLGNFIFDQSFSKETMQGLFATVSIREGIVGEITERIVELNKHYIPTLQSVLPPQI